MRADEEADEFATWAPRPQHQQRIHNFPEPHRNTWENSQFIAYISGVKNGKLGGLTLQLEIPADFIPYAIDLINQVGVALSVDVQPWEAAREEQM
jgi:hypothetical protein